MNNTHKIFLAALSVLGVCGFTACSSQSVSSSVNSVVSTGINNIAAATTQVSPVTQAPAGTYNPSGSHQLHQTPPATNYQVCQALVVFTGNAENLKKTVGNQIYTTMFPSLIRNFPNVFTQGEGDIPKLVAEIAPDPYSPVAHHRVQQYCGADNYVRATGEQNKFFNRSGGNFRPNWRV